MTKCDVCGNDYLCGCLCGFCMSCIEKYTHEKCYEIVENDKVIIDRIERIKKV